MPFRVLVSLALASLAFPAAGAQDDWSTLTPGLGGSVQLADRFGPEWTAGAGAGARAVLPAYGGVARASLDARRYAAARPELPDFRATTATLGWGPTLALPAGARLSGGVLVGALHLRFERLEEIRFQNVTEIEAAVGGWGRLDVPLAGRLGVWLEADVLRVALSDPAALATGSAGLALRLDTPGWLREVLR